jgi:hypothetical protein
VHIDPGITRQVLFQMSTQPSYHFLSSNADLNLNSRMDISVNAAALHIAMLESQPAHVLLGLLLFHVSRCCTLEMRTKLVALQWPSRRGKVSLATTVATIGFTVSCLAVTKPFHALCIEAATPPLLGEQASTRRSVVSKRNSMSSNRQAAGVETDWTSQDRNASSTVPILCPSRSARRILRQACRLPSRWDAEMADDVKVEIGSTSLLECR